MNRKHFKTLSKFLFRELWNGKVIHIIFAAWLITLVTAFLINVNQKNHEIQQFHTNQDALNKYYESIPNAYFFFATIYTVQRPVAPLSFVAQGTSFLAPNTSDYLPRYSPNLYYSDDSNVLFRLFRPFDLTIIVGIVGCLMSLILTYRAVNGEFLDRNYFLLELSGVSLVSRFTSKLFVYQVTMIGTFLVAYIIAIFFASQAFQGSLSRFTNEFILIGLVSVLHVFFSTSFGLAVSSITKSPQKSFSIGISFFLVQVFVVPLIGVEVQGLFGQYLPSATDLQEKKIHFSRLIHRRLDPFLFSVRKRAQNRELTYENLDTVWEDNEKKEFFMFVNNNSNYAMLLDRDFYGAQASFAESVASLSSWFSPFFAYQLATAELSDTGINAEKIIIKELTWDNFTPFRRWFWKNFMGPVNWRSVPLEKWIFAKNPVPPDISELRLPKTPSIPLMEKIGNIWLYIFKLLLWSFGFIALGWFGVQRLNDRSGENV